MTQIQNQATRFHQGVEMSVESVVVNGCTQDTIQFSVNGKDFKFVGAYGNAQRAAKRAINRELGLTVCPVCGIVTCPEAPTCSACYAREGYGHECNGYDEFPRGLDS